MVLSDENHAGRYASAQFRRSLKEGKAYRCKDCGIKVYLRENRWEDDALIIHHIKPLISGGTTNNANLVILCNECHNRRHEELRIKPELPLFRKRKVVGYGKGIVYTAVP